LIKKLVTELFVELGATESRIVAVERVPLFPGSCPGVLPLLNNLDPIVIQLNPLAEYSEERHVVTLIILGIVG
jgi:hypothetical protein